MAHSELQINRIKSRKPVIDLETNSKIKELQRKLVELSFAKGNNRAEYFNTLELIKKLRSRLNKST